MLAPRTVVGARHAPVFAFNVSPGTVSNLFAGFSNVYGRRGPSRIEVLDVARRRKAMDFLPVGKDPLSYYPLELALSPSGRRLALLSGNTVELYDVP